MLAFTFPGQGSQCPGMGRQWVEHPSWELVIEASSLAGRDIGRLLLDADADELRAPRNAQLATFVLSLVTLDAIKRAGLSPSATAACAGHSLGEYSALVAAGALSFEDGMRVVAERGEAMQAACDEQPGVMAALLGLQDDEVDTLCRQGDSEVWAANYNAPRQVVIAGSPASVASVEEAAKALGAKRRRLQVGGAFHTPYMVSARARVRKVLAESDLRDPEVPVVANVDAHVHRSGNEWRSLLADQLCSPVRWHRSIQRLATEGVTTFVEVGPSEVLTGLARKILPEAKTLRVRDPDDIDALLSLASQAITPQRPRDTSGRPTRSHRLSGLPFSTGSSQGRYRSEPSPTSRACFKPKDGANSEVPPRGGKGAQRQDDATMAEGAAESPGANDGTAPKADLLPGDLHHQGEHLHVDERLVVSPAAGIFRPVPTADGTQLEGGAIPIGGLLGKVAEHEVRSPFAGSLMGMLVLPGERVLPGQRIAWLRVP